MRVAAVARARGVLALRQLVRRRRGGAARPAGALLGLALAAEAGVALAVLLGAALVGLLVFDLGDAVATLLADSDLELLRRAPLAPATLFALKLADAFPRSALLLAVLALPAAAAFGARWPLPAWAWALLPLQLLALWAVPLGAGAAAAIVLLGHVPAARARETLALLSTVALTALWIGNGVLLPRLAEEGAPFGGTLREAVAAAGAARIVPPATWAADALVAAARGDVIRALAWTLALIGAAAAAIALAARVASARLDEALARVHTTARTRGRRARARARPRSALAAIVLRDGRAFVRDWTVLGDVLTAAVLWTALPLLGAPLGAFEPSQLGAAMLVLLAVGLGYEIGARTVPFEREGLAWARLAPIGPGRWVRAKLVGAAALAAPLLGLATVTVGLGLGLEPAALGRTVVTAGSALLVSLSLGLWTGTTFGDPEWTNPRAMLNFQGRLVSALLLIVQVTLWLGLAALTGASGLGPALGLAAPPLLAVAACAGLLRVTASRLSAG